MAAIASARQGAQTLLLERGGCLGGMWTGGLLGFTLDSGNKGGMLREFLTRLEQLQKESGAPIYEAQKYLLEEMCCQAGVKTLLHTQVCACECAGGNIKTLSYINKSGLQTINPKMAVDATGDGDVAVMAGCGWDYGREEDGKAQPMSMIVVVSGLDEREAAPYISYPGRPFWEAREKVLELLKSIGASFSIGCPSFQKINDSLYYLSANHEYGWRSDDGEAVTQATFHARKELFELTALLRQKGGPVFRNLTLAATPETIGVREGRRVHGLYTITKEDMLAGRQHADAVCKAAYWVDIHALAPEGGKGFDDGGIQAKPYDIPFRALLPKDCGNLVLAGRCISGDFYAHASYRVAGNMAPVGEAAGKMAAVAALTGQNIRHLRFEDYNN